MIGPWRSAWARLRQPTLAWAEQAQTGTAAEAWRTTGALALAALVAAFVGLTFVGLDSGGFGYRFLPLAALWRVLTVLLGLLALALLVAEAALLWAPRFGAVRERPAAQRAALLGLTPVWLWGQALVWPALWWAWPLAAGLAVWQVHLGLRHLMRPPPPRAPAFSLTSLSTVALLLVLLLVGRCSAPQGPALMPVFPWEPPPSEGVVLSAPAAASGVGALGAAEPLGAGGGGQRVALAPPDGAGSGAFQLPPGSAASTSTDLERWAASGKPSEPITRTVLEDLLPGAIEGFDRRVTESYAHAPDQGDAMRQVLTTGALARVENVSRQDRSRYLHATLEDLHGHGEALAAKLLTELADTGGQADSSDGRTRRRMGTSADGDVITVEECFLPYRQCKLELLVGQRYHLRVESAQMESEALRAYVAQVNLGALSARAKAKKPVE